MLGGFIGALGLSLSGLLFSIEWVILTFGALYGEYRLNVAEVPLC
jgi:hypothetical protein